MAVQPANDTANNSETKNDPTLNARRLLAWGLSAALGLGLSAFVMVVVLGAPLMDTFLLSFVEVPTVIMAAIPATFFFLIWIDVFMGTGILPD
jgi:hypothetical protein